MKKLLASTQYILAFILGLLAMYYAISGKLDTSASAEMFVFVLGLMLTMFSAYATYTVATDK
jgi:hypothetical protein